MEREEITANSIGIVASDHEGDGLDEVCPEDGANLKMYMCGLCDSKVTALESLREHYKQKHVRAGKTLRTRQSITAWSKKKHACPHCDYRSNLVGHVKRHILIHIGEKPFECSHCGCKFRDKTTLRRHVDRHVRNKPNKYGLTEDKKYQCKKCEFTTSYSGALSRHLLRHEDPKICQQCSAQFWKQESYENHVLLHAGVALHPCKFCDYETNVAGQLKNHVKRMHSGNKSWVCLECNYASSSASDLSKHKVIHKHDRPYACELCEYTCKRRSHLTVHQATHDDTLKNYSCPFCDYKTILISTLRVHIRSHTGERPFKCNDCGLTFASVGGVKSHAYTHIKNWSQTCPHCGFTAGKPHLFRKHMQIHNKKPGALSTKTNHKPSLLSRSNETRLSKKPGKLSTKTNHRLPSMETKETHTPKKQKNPRLQIPRVTLNMPNPTDKSFNNPPPFLPTSSNSLKHDDPTYYNACKPDPDEFLIKSELDHLPSLLLEIDDGKIEDVDILYPVKQERDTP